ncbi:hypothetical protein HK405_013683 [Cladochytrium tenue]|nr:hypothetical protein HK405_013683 [Cladochytrium tenue]
MLFQTVLNLVFDYAHVPHEKVSLDANLQDQLLIGRLDRRFCRDLASAREAADWISSRLEEVGRLQYH